MRKKVPAQRTPTCTTYTPNEQPIDNEELTFLNGGVRTNPCRVYVGVRTSIESASLQKSTYTRQVEQNQLDTSVGVEGVRSIPAFSMDENMDEEKWVTI